MTIKVLGIDLGKRYFHVHAVDKNGVLITRKKLKRKELLLFLSNLEPCLIGIEACGGAHYLARKAEEFGHTPKLMAIVTRTTGTPGVLDTHLIVLNFTFTI